MVWELGNLVKKIKNYKKLYNLLGAGVLGQKVDNVGR